MNRMDDIVFATVALLDRCGASGFEVGHNGDPEDNADDVRWSATCMFRGARLFVDDRHSPEEACFALSLRLLEGGTCKCLQPITLTTDVSGCHWRLVRDRWEPGCTAAPIPVNAERGDYAAVQRAMGDAMAQRLLEPANRAARRASRRGRKRR